jgi:hypothetical protein
MGQSFIMTLYLAIFVEFLGAIPKADSQSIRDVGDIFAPHVGRQNATGVGGHRECEITNRK